MPSRQEETDTDCAGWEVVCPDGRVRHLPYHNLGDAQSHARFASRFSLVREARMPPCPEARPARTISAALFRWGACCSSYRGPAHAP